MDTKRKTFFFWADGMAETIHPTSLESARLETIDCLLSNAITGFYYPIRQHDLSSPKTDVVIPYMFFVEPEQYCGRAALELIDAGHKLTPGECIASVRAVECNQGSHNWRALPPLTGQRVQSLVEQATRLSCDRVEVVLSPFARHGNMLILRARSEQDMLHFRANKDSIAGFRLLDWEMHTFQPPSPLPGRIAFGGWSSGSLRGAFRLMGATVNEYDQVLFDLDSRRKDLERLLQGPFQESLNSHDVFAFFVKDTDTASHKNDRTRKIEAIEFLDWIVGMILRFTAEPLRVVVLADHPTDLGSPESNFGPTPYLVADAPQSDYATPSGHFCEANIPQTMIISNKELRGLVYSPLDITNTAVRPRLSDTP